MIQSAILLCEDGLHERARHAEDVVILRLVVCVSDVANHHQTRGVFILPLSLSFSVSSDDCTNCPVVLLLLQSPLSLSAQEMFTERDSQTAPHIYTLSSWQVKAFL